MWKLDRLISPFSCWNFINNRKLHFCMRSYHFYPQHVIYPHIHYCYTPLIWNEIFLLSFKLWLARSDEGEIRYSLMWFLISSRSLFVPILRHSITFFINYLHVQLHHVTIVVNKTQLTCKNFCDKINLVFFVHSKYENDSRLKKMKIILTFAF